MAVGPQKITAGYTGKMAICACGLSHDKPFCDGRHRGTGKQPWKFQVEQGQEILLCACGHSAKKPFCDSSHEALSGGGGGGLGRSKRGTSW